MAAPKVYQWDFDHKSSDALGLDLDSVGFVEYATCSVGVFQWLPKSNGKGLKKSKTIRIQGYVAEIDRVYQKARQVCAQLNKARVMADDPPAWVQKHYSIPKPTGYVVERTTDALTGSQMRQARLHVANELLLPEGFVKAEAGTYVRRQSDQLHMIDFQPDRWGLRYTVNLGFHYTFVRGFFQGRILKPAEYVLLDFAWRARIGGFLSGHDVWFDYPKSLDAAKDVLRQNCRDALQALAKYALKWQRPAWWLEDLNTKHEPPAKRVRPWSSFHGAWWTAAVASQLGKNKLAAQVLKSILSDESSAHWRQQALIVTKSIHAR